MSVGNHNGNYAHNYGHWTMEEYETGFTSPREWIDISGPAIGIRFKSDASIVDRGFEVEFRCSFDCSQNLCSHTCNQVQ